jgi:2'-5' RNA ligase
MERIFAALDLPDEIRDGLDVWGARELADPALRPVRAAALHMTVCFLGWTPPERVDEAQEVFKAIEPRRVKLRLRPLPVAKPPRRPSLFALEAEAPEASALAEEVAAKSRNLELAEEEKRPFWPHVTVARVRSETGGGRSRRRRPLPVERLPGPLPEELGGEFHAVRLCLYRSMIGRDGSQYVPLCNLNLR